MTTDRHVELDRRHLWHPFTQTSEWWSYEPLVVERAEGFYLVDTRGRRYLDAISSLWCNVHGHGHPHVVASLKEQIDRVCHTTLLGLTHVPAVELAARLAELAPDPLTRVFFSDSGSTAVEVALRMAFQYWRQVGRPEKRRFLALTDAYHGDTLGSVSLGFSEPFHTGYEPLTFEVKRVDPPFLRPPIDGRHRCDHESLETATASFLAEVAEILEREGSQMAAFFIEPLVQGAAGIWPHPPSLLRGLAALCREHEVLLVCDEVATGFGRTGTLFAVEQAGIAPDLLCLGKGLSAGYLPVAATLATEEVFAAFTGPYSQYRTLFHGHTYGGNPLGCAAALANLDVFESEETVATAAKGGRALARALAEWIDPLEHTGPVRRVGMMVGFDLLRDPGAGTGYPVEERRGHRAVLEARELGVIVRPLGDTMILMPPLTLPEPLLRQAVEVTARAVAAATRED